MKMFHRTSKLLIGLVLSALVAGCAGHLLDKENAAVAAGFKVITPTQPDQQAILRKLPANKVTWIEYHDKTYYVLPDLKNNQAYVGGPKQYQSYQQLRQKQLKNSKSLEAANEAGTARGLDRMNWDQWNGWGSSGGTAEPGWY